MLLRGGTLSVVVSSFDDYPVWSGNEVNEVKEVMRQQTSSEREIGRAELGRL